MAAYWEIAAHSVYDIFSKFKYLIVYLLLPASILNFFLIAHFSDHCLLVPFYVSAFRNQNCMVTCFTNVRNLQEGMIFLFNSEKSYHVTDV